MPTPPSTVSAHTHACLISDQPIPNLLPLLMERPKRAIFLVSPEKTMQAERLKRIVEPRGICVQIHPIESAYDFPAMVRTCEELIASAEGTQLTLNVTAAPR